MKPTIHLRIIWAISVLQIPPVVSSASGEAYTPIASRGTSFTYCQLGEAPRCHSAIDFDFGGVDDLAPDPNDPGVFWAVTEALRTDGDVELLRVDPSSGEIPTKYPLNTETPFTGLAIDPTDGQFYGMTEKSELVRIDPTTGSVVPIGTLNLKPSSRSPLAINSDGDLFGASFLISDASGGTFSGLVQIDKTTGNATLLGELGVGIRGIAFHPETNALHGVGNDDELFDIDPIDGATVVIGPSIARARGLVYISTPTPYDCDASGVLDLGDIDCQSNLTIASLLDEVNIIPGDFDLDGVVGFSDFLILSTNFRRFGGYADGNIDASGAIVFEDFLAFSRSFGQQSVPNVRPVPEPQLSMAVLAMELLFVAGLFRKAGFVP